MLGPTQVQCEQFLPKLVPGIYWLVRTQLVKFRHIHTKSEVILLRIIMEFMCHDKKKLRNICKNKEYKDTLRDGRKINKLKGISFKTKE